MEYLEIKFTHTQPIFENICISDDPLVGMLFKQIVKEYSDLQGMADQAAAAYLGAIVQLLTQQERYNTQRSFRFIDASTYNELSQTIIRYLEKHFGEDITLDGLAELLGYNKSYLCVAFKKDTHSTIVDFLNMIRIRRAAELIAGGGYLWLYQCQSLYPRVCQVCRNYARSVQTGLSCQCAFCTEECGLSQGSSGAFYVQCSCTEVYYSGNGTGFGC